MKTQRKMNGLSERHVAQIIRRKMIQKVKPSNKTYNRKKHTRKLNED
jgi:hypothetical protein